MNIDHSSTFPLMRRLSYFILTLLLMGMCQYAVAASPQGKYAGRLLSENVRIVPSGKKVQSRVSAQSGDGISETFMCNRFGENSYTNYGGIYLNNSNEYAYFWNKPDNILYEENQTVLNYTSSGSYFYFRSYDNAPVLEAVKVYLDPEKTNNASVIAAYADFDSDTLDYSDTEIVADYDNNVLYWKPDAKYDKDNIFFYIETGELNVIGFSIYSEGMTPSDFLPGSEEATVAPPVFSPAGCEFKDPLSVEILSNEGNAVYYTTDGSVPTVSDNCRYNGPFAVSSTTVVKAIAVDAEDNSSRIVSATYTCIRHGVGEDYDPESPGNPSPEEQKVKHPVVVRSVPSGASTFSPSGTFDMEENTSRFIYAYPENGWKLVGWTVNGEQRPEVTSPLEVTMGEKALDIAACFEYSPASPVNPGSNYYDSSTGRLIMDDFAAGNLYNSIKSVIGTTDFSNVFSLIVKGKMDSNDMGVFLNFGNANIIDLSRTGDVGSIPSYAFYSLNASEILLPGTVTAIGSYAFSGCQNLRTLTVYSPVPPVCDPTTFADCPHKADLTVYVPVSALELYDSADYWKDFTILPITNDAHMLQVNLPENADDGRYKHNTLELVNVNSGVRQKYVISDRLLYTFNGLRKDEQYNVYMFSQAGLELGRIENVVIPDNDIEVTFDKLKTLHTVFAQVVDPEGTDVTPQVTVEWLKPLADGTVTYLRKSTSLGEVPEGQQLICRVTLDSKLGPVCVAPEDVEFTVDGQNNTCTVNLAAFRSIELCGGVVDGEGAALSGASVSVNQTLNGKYSKTYTSRTDRSGRWTVEVLDAPETRLTYSASECVNVNDTIGAFAADVTKLDLGRTMMRSIVGARVTYGFTYHAAGVDEVQSYYSDYQNVVVSVFNVTQNRVHKDVSMQYPIIAVLDENINTGDELQLTATSKTGAFNPIVKTVTVGDNQHAEVTFDIVGKGGISASFEMTDNPEVVAMLYSNKGELLQKKNYSEAKALFTELEDGEYTLVSMGNSELMSSILRLSNFGEIGLTEGKDYVRNTVTVESGKLREVKIPEVPIFDESLFYYTTPSTVFSANKSSVTTGNYLTLRAAIDFKGIYKEDISNVSLVVDLPEACDFVEQSVMQENILLPYTFDKNRLTVQLGNNYQGQTRFCIMPTSGGTFNATALIVFDYKGMTLIQPIGTIASDVKDIEIVVPTSTNNETFRVSGTCRGHADVIVYIDDVMTAQVKANAAGTWTTECSLTEPDTFSSHTVYAQFKSEHVPVLESETRTVVYNPYDVNVQNVEMTFMNNWNHRQYSVVWDFERGTANVRSYDFYTDTEITFLIRLSYHDVKLLPYVWLHVFTSDGKVRSLRADYNNAKDCWVVVDSFSSKSLPTRCSVSIENMMFDVIDEVSYNLLMDQYIGEIRRGDTFEKGDGIITTEYIDKDGDPIASIDSYETDNSVENEIGKYKNLGFEEDDLLDDDNDYIPEDEDDILDEEVKTMTKEDGSIAMICGGMGNTTRVVVIKIIKEEGKNSKTSLVSSIISREWCSFIRTYKQGCADITEYAKYTEYLDKYVTITTSSIIAHTAYVNPKLVPPGTKIPAKKVMAKIRRIRHHSKRRLTQSIEYAVDMSECNPKPPIPPTPPIPPVEPIHDPSGFVYEAVPENRVEGVQASIYYKETKEDMYGDPYEEIVLWNAEEYAQQNPLFTDENGMYRWDVPQGLWQVKFEKDGYVTAYSDWLPVPPPQLEVNIGIVQNKQPEVTEARAYEEGVEVQFDKFMDLSTLTTDNIFVTANGEKLNGEIRMVDPALADEYASEDDADALRYASRVRFVPEQPLGVTTGEIRLTVSRNVLSYAGIPMTETFSQVLDVEKEVQSIYADDVKVLYGGEKEVTVYALPYEAAVGCTLHIAKSSDLIASTDITEAVLDDEGKAVVKVRGDLPGRTQLTFSIDDVTVTGDCAVDVVREIITAEAPKSSRASGTAVYRGTKIELTTESKNGTIYFTTDGSCPCDENGTRRKYTVPIIINDDTRILAMTSVGTGEGDVSETVEFNYTLKHSDMDFQMAEGWTWISHNLESEVPATELTSDESIQRIMSQTAEVVRDPRLGMVGTLSGLVAPESYKVESNAATARKRMSDVAWNPATPIALNSGWNWLGYPAGQTMTPDEAFAPTKAETLDVVVGQNGFAQYDGEKWVGTLETMSPGMGYMYQSQTAKNVVYNTAIVSNAAARYAAGITANSPLALDIHKYPSVMPVIATLGGSDGTPLDNEDYQVAAFCGTECRGIGRTVDGLVMMNVYGNPDDRITFGVTDAEGEESYSTDASLRFSEDVVGDLFNPYVISINVGSGVAGVRYDGDVRVRVDRDMLLVRGIRAEDIDLLEVYSINGQKLIRETIVPESGVRVSSLEKGVYVVVVYGNGEYTYHRVVVN